MNGADPPGAPVRILNGQEAEDAQCEIMDRVFAQAIRPHLDRILQLARRRKFAGVVFEPLGDAASAARVFGWDGAAPVWPLTKRGIAALAPSDEITRRWCAVKPNGDRVRLFVMVHLATFLLNWDEENGWHTEPGSTDGEAAAIH